jgi:hypothetical protein
VQALLLRLTDATGPGACWILIFLAAIAAVYALYVGIALRAALRASNQKQEVSYQIFRDLLDFALDLRNGRRRR